VSSDPSSTSISTAAAPPISTSTSTATSAPAASLDCDELAKRFSDLGVSVVTSSMNRSSLRVGGGESLELLTRLRDDASLCMRRLTDLTAVDRLGGTGDAAERFEIVYWLHSPVSLQSLRVMVPLEGEDPSIDSVSAVWPVAEWLEREVFDLFGIRFPGHPDLRRLLLDPEFEGAPLRKDHPLRLAGPRSHRGVE
jgi:NADH:ubiquinone oxidoreductase subunit C